MSPNPMLFRQQAEMTHLYSLAFILSLQNIYTKAKNRILWKNIVNQVVELAYS